MSTAAAAAPLAEGERVEVTGRAHARRLPARVVCVEPAAAGTDDERDDALSAAKYSLELDSGEVVHGATAHEHGVVGARLARARAPLAQEDRKWSVQGDCQRG